MDISRNSIVGTKRSIAPYKEDGRKVGDGVTTPCAYMRVAITPTSRRIEISMPDGGSHSDRTRAYGITRDEAPKEEQADRNL